MKRKIEHPLLEKFLSLREIKDLEQLGKELDAKELGSLLKACKETGGQEERLSPLLVGVTPEIFATLLAQGDEKVLTLLKQEAKREPLCHHLTVFAHEVGRWLTQIGAVLAELTGQIQWLRARILEKEDLQPIEQKLYETEYSLHKILHSVKCALSLGWNTDRADLVKELSCNKDFCLYELKNVEIVRDLLNSLVASVFTTLPPAADDDPAIEGLHKLAIWYLKDYWDLGLLPHLSEHEAHGNDLTPHLVKIQENLQKAGLFKVSDLKRLKITSKQSLTSYLKKDFNL